jgi:hypothetical protein
MDLSKISTKDLEYIKANKLDKVSTAGLQAFAEAKGMSAAPQASVVAPVEYSPMAEVARSAAGGATFQFADELEAALRTGSISSAEYTKLRDQLRGQQGQFKQDYPKTAIGTELAGGLAMPIGAALKPVTRGAGLFGDVALGTGMGALTGAGMAQEQADIPGQAVVGSLFGGGVTAGLSGAGRLLAPNIRPEAAALRQQGIPLTPGAAFGGAIQRIEQGAESIPMLGDIVKTARQGQFEKFNTAAYNKVLSNLNPTLKVPEAAVGRDAYKFVEDSIKLQYESVLPKISIQYTPRFESALDAVKKRYSGTKLPDELKKEFAGYVDGLKADFAANQVLNGRRAQAVKEDLAAMSQAYSSSTGKDRLLADAYRDLQGVYMNSMRNQNPKYGKDLGKADAAYRDFVRVQNAMNKTRGEEGVFTPAQLESAVRQSDRSVRKGAFARGAAPMQDLSGVATSVLGSKVPDSGTATRGMIGAVGAGGALGAVSPMAAGVSGLLTLPYSKYGEKAMFAPRNETFAEAVQRARTASPFAVPGLLGLTQ